MPQYMGAVQVHLDSAKSPAENEGLAREQAFKAARTLEVRYLYC